MPGILPMKVIKVGTTAQSRIAQACDRCRSKKIRCDGVRPTCSQCSSVGFECRTSDKLSRRAFPRGYTESLEERVRALETEVRELKDLLDEKDEKIDMLSRMHANRPTPPSSSDSPDSRRDPIQPPNEDTFYVHSSPLMLQVDGSDSYFMGPSSGRAFIEAFKRRFQESGKPPCDFAPEDFLHIKGVTPLVNSAASAASPQPPQKDLVPPPRLFSDRCVNVYFQEWAPLFPVLHKPTFLRIYEEFVSDPAKIKSSYKNALLYLVFSIAGLSQESPDMAQLDACEAQWNQSLEQLLNEDSVETLKGLILAIMYCTMRADYRKLQHYKAIAVGLSHRLGLHQSQKRFSFGALTAETRKKVFWTLYTLDCFTAATLGLPKLLKEEDVQVEYPSDTDDEYVTEKGFQPTLPGESTRLSNALALFRASRILARVLATNYPATSSAELSLQRMDALGTELDVWCDNLPNHLRLNFVQGKPSTDVTGSRSPLLSLAYHFIRTLIYRPAVGSSLGHKAAPALLAISESSKHIVQIVELLEERHMIFSFCFNRSDLLTMCGMTLLYRAIGLKKDSKLMREDERLVNAVIRFVDGAETSAGSEQFRKIASRLISVSGMDSHPNATPAASSSSPCPSDGLSMYSARRSLAARKPRSLFEESDDGDAHPNNQERMRRMTMPNLAEPDADLLQHDNRMRHSVSHASDSFHQRHHRHSAMQQQQQQQQHGRQNLDYLSLNSTPSPSRHTSPPLQQQQQQQQHSGSAMPPPPPAHSMPHQQHCLPLAATKHHQDPPVSGAEWEMLLGTMDGGMNNVYDAIYGGRGFTGSDDVAVPPPPPPPQHMAGHGEWSPDSWDLSTFSIVDFGNGGGAGGDGPAVDKPEGAKPQSVVSLSDESLSSGEDVAPSELGLTLDYPGSISGEGFILEGLDTFPL